MVDSIGSAGIQASAVLLAVQKNDPIREKQEISTSSSPNAVDEVSLSNEAMDIGRVMEIVQDAKAHIESNPKTTLSGGGELLDELV